MAEGPHRLTHLFVQNRSKDGDFHRPARGNVKIRPIEDRAGHYATLRGQIDATLETIEESRIRMTMAEDELRALGSIITLEGMDASFPLKIDSLQQWTRHRPPRSKWILLSVTAKSESEPERASVWVSDEYRAEFIKLFEDYLSRETITGKPKNVALIANITSIRRTLLRDLWQTAGDPPIDEDQWWEIWLLRTPDSVRLIKVFAATQQLRISERVLEISDRTIVWVKAIWRELEPLPLTAVPIAEIRRPEFINTIEDLPRDVQNEYVEEFATRITPADHGAPAVVHLDTGVARTHVLLKDSLDETELHSVFGVSGFDVKGHGTLMAGLALFGDLDRHFVGTAPVVLQHRLESVRIWPGKGETPADPIAYGDITIEAVNVPEIIRQRPRVFCMPITADREPDQPGEPTLWSASVDALAAGVDVVRSPDGLTILGVPTPSASRLIVVSAGNVPDEELTEDHLVISDQFSVQDPAQAWNALTVGAYTKKTDNPITPDYEGWRVVAPTGELSPHSRTSLLFNSNRWPIKPEIVMEGGNTLTDGTITEPKHPLLSLQTTSWKHDLAIESANATSAATAQASRLAALAMAAYPFYWPETIRGLLVHAAEWTPEMRSQIDSVTGKQRKQKMLRRYGWGVPTEEAVLTSSRRAVTLVSQDQFVPFVGAKYAMPTFRLHELPWPAEALELIDSGDVTLKVTLSYFVEPTAARRGWRQKYSYASHALRFELQLPTESPEAFIERINREVDREEGDQSSASSGSIDWLIGPQQRNLGSLHQDILETSGQALARSKAIVVYPVGGWWKKNLRKDRLDLPIRYALIVSISTPEEGIDLYTPIATMLELPIPIEILGS